MRLSVSETPKPMIIRRSGLGYSVFVYRRKGDGPVAQVGEVKHHTFLPWSLNEDCGNLLKIQACYEVIPFYSAADMTPWFNLHENASCCFWEYSIAPWVRIHDAFMVHFWPSGP